MEDFLVLATTRVTNVPFFKLTFMCVCAHACARVYAGERMPLCTCGGPRTMCGIGVLFFHHAGSGNRTHVVRVARKCFTH